MRLDDMIIESLMRAHLWAMDRNITKTYAEDVVEGVNNFLRFLARGANPAISGGTCWFDPEMNTKDTMDAGQAYFNFDYGRYGIAERVTFAARINNDYTVDAIFG
jgi:phage tail sheath protein FI